MVKRNEDETCSFKNNPKCYLKTEASYNSTCCTPDHPCGIYQGGCQTDEDCFSNLECLVDSCGLKTNGTQCCQAPGRKPGLLYHVHTRALMTLLYLIGK